MDGVQDSELKVIQAYLLDMLVDVDRILRESNVTYHLDGGTAIGAVRHKGFIPWDDDVDIEIDYKDEEAFVKAMEKLPKEKYFLLKPFSLDWPFEFYKIKLNGTEAIEVDQGNTRIHRGLSIDVFVYKDFPTSPMRKRLYYLVMDFNKAIELAYRPCYGKKYLDPVQKIMRTILIANYKILDMITEKDTNKTLCRLSFLPKNIEYEKEWTAGTIEQEFEGKKFLAFAEYDKVLGTYFGDYMTLPPEDKRKRHILSFRVLDGNEDGVPKEK